MPPVTPQGRDGHGRRPRPRRAPARPQPHRPARGAAPVRAGHMNAAGHAEVEARPRSPVQLEPEVLAVTPHRPHATAAQPAAKASRGDAFEDDRVVGDVRLDDATSRRDVLGRAPRGLDLGQPGPGGGRARGPRAPPGRPPPPRCPGPRAARPRPRAARAREDPDDQPSPSWGGAPPSITMVSPFMNEDAAEARKMQGWES